MGRIYQIMCDIGPEKLVDEPESSKVSEPLNPYTRVTVILKPFSLFTLNLFINSLILVSHLKLYFRYGSIFKLCMPLHSFLFIFIYLISEVKNFLIFLIILKQILLFLMHVCFSIFICKT